jgi:dTDP-glucose 4,6-dehydratase
MKKAVVTGGLGFIGSHLCERLLEMDYSLEIIDNGSNFLIRSALLVIIRI